MVDVSDEVEATFVEEVGRRLRAIRRQQHLSLEEVEHRSGGRWSASAIGAYERGYRNLSLGRLRELADFYGVPISVLVGEADPRTEAATAAGPAANRVTLDVAALERQPEAAPVARYAQSIAMERGDFNGRMLTLRKDDLRMLGSVLQLSESDLIERLAGWGVLHGEAPAPAPATVIDLTERSPQHQPIG
jgi:transcriptional regulator with XRE-family HTH domain